MKRGTIILIFALLIGLGIAAAEEGISITEINSTTNIQPDEIGIYNLLVKNLGSRELNVQLAAEPYAGLSTSDFEYVFVEPNYVTLSGNEEVEIQVELKLNENVARQKRYNTYITATAINYEDISTQYDLQVFAMPPEDPITVTLSENADSVGPGSQLEIRMHLENEIHKDISNLEVYVSSDLFEDQQTIELFSNQEKDLTFTFTVPKDAAPELHTYNVRLYYDDALQVSVNGDFNVDENLNMTKYTETESGFLYETRTVTLTNNGNSLVSDFYETNPGTVEGWFTSYSVDPSYESGIPTWTFSLAAGEEFVLIEDEDYRPLVVGIIVLILLGLVVYYLFVKRVTLHKETFRLKFSDEGVADFKVLLHLKNSTNKTIKDITVVDVLPKLIQPKTNFGTLHPNGIERGEKGIRIMWKIPELVSGEERIISYEVEPQFKIIGDISLPNAIVKYKNANNRAIHTRSNRVNVISGIVDMIIGGKKK